MRRSNSAQRNVANKHSNSLVNYMAKVKVKTDKQATITDYEVPVGWVVELNFFDMTGEKAKTRGTSAKMYHLEVQSSKDGTQYQLYSEYGPTGGAAAHDWRYFGTDKDAAETEFNSIKKAKLKKGYVEIDVAQRTLGSDEAKKHVKAVTLKNAEALPAAPKSTMTTAQQAIVSLFFNAQYLGCPEPKVPTGSAYQQSN